MRRNQVFNALFVTLAISGCGAPMAGSAGGGPSGADAPVRNIILLIADGAGAGLWAAAAYGTSELAVKRMRVGGLVDTRSAGHKVTDSAAGASVYATGQRVMNRTISVGHECPLPRSEDRVEVAWPTGCEALESWFQIARSKGKATGLVTTTDVVDATPAAFVAHSPSRYWMQMIAEQFAEADLDVLLGGGRRYFAADGRDDGRDLIGEMCARSDCFLTAEGFDTYQPTDRPLVGLFTPGDMDDADPRPVSVPVMVAAALAKLERDPDGFVAMFETESTDNSTHGNEPLEEITGYMIEFDRAVGVALGFARRNPGTLVIVTGDHETGGISLVERGTDVNLAYATGGHSASPVPLFAEGPRAERFGGFRENYEIGEMLLEIVRGW